MISVGPGGTIDVQAFLALEALTFGLAASIHAGLLMAGYEHRQAARAETAIAVVLMTRRWSARVDKRQRRASRAGSSVSARSCMLYSRVRSRLWCGPDSEAGTINMRKWRNWQTR